jgi:hypothetical protein
MVFKDKIVIITVLYIEDNVLSRHRPVPILSNTIPLAFLGPSVPSESFNPSALRTLKNALRTLKNPLRTL